MDVQYHAPVQSCLIHSAPKPPCLQALNDLSLTALVAGITRIIFISLMTSVYSSCSTELRDCRNATMPSSLAPPFRFVRMEDGKLRGQTFLVKVVSVQLQNITVVF